MAGEQIGFIGLGNQGGPIAHRIVDAGLPTIVWARRAEVLEPYIAKGAVAASSVTALGALCRHVGICVVNDADVLSVCDELIPAMGKGSRIAVHSTVLPETCVAIAERCAPLGIDVIDAPVSGGARRAVVGALAVMCGGDQAVFDAARPIFETFGEEIVLLGPIGSGQRAKIINNNLLAANIGVANAALDAGETLGLDRQALVQIIKASSGYSKGLEACAMFDHPSGYSGMSLMIKDLSLLTKSLPGDTNVEILREAIDPYVQKATAEAN